MTPHDLMRGKGCPVCGTEQGHLSKRLERDEVLKRAEELHGGKYLYDRFVYTRMCDKGIITCPIHGDFKQTMRKHLSGSGCPKCGYERNADTFRIPIDKVIEKCEKVHNGKYQYLKDFDYFNNKTRLHIVCPIHGEFWQEAIAHFHGQGCPECGREEAARKLRKDKEHMIKRARIVHGDKYSYDNFEYVNWHTKGLVTCPKHGDFLVTPLNHISNRSGCPKCAHQVSKWEKDVGDFISSLGIEVEHSNRSILGGKEIDIFLPQYNIGIECDGLRWHNELYTKKNYHLDKTNDCAEKGVRLIHIFEDEWKDKDFIWKSMLRNIFGMVTNRVYARKCQIMEVSAKDTRDFLEGNHIQGYANSKFNYGLYYENELVSIMTFGIPRINLGGKKELGHYELVRFCNRINTNVIGGASKLFSHFVKLNNPDEIVSYSDKRWSLGNLYQTLGFENTHDSKPNYFYVYNFKRMNRFRFRKSLLIKEGFDGNKTEHDIMLERGIFRIYDCGTKVWKWKNIPSELKAN